MVVFPFPLFMEEVACAFQQSSINTIVHEGFTVRFCRRTLSEKINIPVFPSCFHACIFFYSYFFCQTIIDNRKNGIIKQTLKISKDNSRFCYDSVITSGDYFDQASSRHLLLSP